MQWFSLMILTVGCMVKHFDAHVLGTEFNVDIFLLLILVQVSHPIIDTRVSGDMIVS